MLVQLLLAAALPRSCCRGRCSVIERGVLQVELRPFLGRTSPLTFGCVYLSVEIKFCAFQRCELRSCFRL